MRTESFYEAAQRLKSWQAATELLIDGAFLCEDGKLPDDELMPCAVAADALPQPMLAARWGWASYGLQHAVEAVFAKSSRCDDQTAEALRWMAKAADTATKHGLAK